MAGPADSALRESQWVEPNQLHDRAPTAGPEPTRRCGRRTGSTLRGMSRAGFDGDLQTRHRTTFWAAENEVWDVGAITAFFAMSNRLANLTALAPNAEFGAMGRYVDAAQKVFRP